MMHTTFALVVFLAAASHAAVFNITGSDTTHYLYDSLGRVRLFHGVNLVTKQYPWYDPTLLDDSVAATYAQQGVTVIRLGFMWTGAEPQPNQFNMTYYAIIKSIVLNFANHGIYSLLDVHQDGLSSKFCLYDGAPLWVVDKSIPRHPFPWPLSGACASRPWAENELTEAAGQAYQNLYQNFRGMRDDFVNFWQHSASYFASVPILGYEIMNEPFAGDIYKNPTLLLPGVAGRDNLQVLYDAVSPAIRANDNNHLIFYEPVTWGMILNGQVTGSGFDHVPGGQQYRSKSVFSFHYYCWLIGVGNVSKFIRTACDAGLGDQVFRAVYDDVDRLGGAAFLTEYGADTCSPHSGNATECIAVMDMSTHTWTSWINWPGSGLDPRPLGLTRPYVRALSGTPLNASFAHDTASMQFSFCYVVNATIVAPTEVYVDFDYYYPTGVTVQSSANVKASVSKQDLLITVTPVGQVSGQHACVTFGRS